MSWEDLTGAGVTHGASPAESERFGLSIGRVVVAEQDPRATTAVVDPREEPASRELLDTLRRAHEDVLVVRWPARRVLLGAVAARSGRVIVPVGALTYWGTPADRLAASRPAGDGHSDTELAVTSAADLADDARTRAVEVVRTVVEASFAGYGNHYTADPLLDPGLALEGYVEWAVRSLDTGDEDVLVLTADGAPVGVATLSLDRAGSDLEILLAGLVPAGQGRGWYGDLLAGVGRAAVDRGATRVIISTQAHNTGVQRAWARAGFEPFAAVETVHAIRAPLWDARAD